MTTAFLSKFVFSYLLFFATLPSSFVPRFSTHLLYFEEMGEYFLFHFISARTDWFFFTGDGPEKILTMLGFV
jgi:hypothetical protein